MLSLISKPLCVLLILVGLFGLIRLRSVVLSVNYDIRNLEEKKMDALKNTKLLLAEKSKYASIEKLAVSFREAGQEANPKAGEDNLFGNRVRVIHIKKSTGPRPYTASLQAEELK